MNEPMSQPMLLLVTFDLSNADLYRFETYEETVLPLLKRHGAGLKWRVRSADAAAEYHLLQFPGHQALSDYRSDPERERLQDDWISCGAIATSVEVFDVS